ncbi:protein phosphatase Slingshot homolog 2b [Syngnathus typhle]|uniref:protein phosphatase Slingshot homolog 2b n=1 Tax=Syngnathus typhle TaxID=161592 RepID=UPI002A6B6682|nr:protein phosphatase Slingshot homolog 2b [Syngnathus typhle]
MALVTVQRSPTPSATSSPCVSESGSGEDDRRSQPRSISESFLTVKGAALFLPRGNGSSSSCGSRFSQLRSKHAGDIQQHLQTMFTVLRPEDNIKLAVRLESVHALTRYMVVVSTNGRQDTEESLVLGVDFSPVDSSCSVGLVLPLWSDTMIHLDGDGGFSVSTDGRVHVFKPVSVQAMWSALQSLHKACEVARCHNYFPGSLFLTWVSYYQSRVSSDQSRINEWNAMRDLHSHRADSPVLFSETPTEREMTERQIKSSLREIMMQKDLENVTCKEIRTALEMHMTCNLREFKEYIDNEMIVILGQMDSPTQIFDHVFLGSEWNASNLEELQSSGVHYILNVTREIDNFFPGVFEYHNIRVYDEEATDLLAYWNDTFKFITRAKKSDTKCLVHCKMGVSRSAATVIAYAMKEYGWDLRKAFDHVKERRAVTKPNPSFMRQLEEYQGILLASKQRHNKLWRSHSDSDLSEHHEPLCTAFTQAHSPGRSDDQAATPPGPSVKGLLESSGSGPAVRGARRPVVPSRPFSSPPCDGVAAPDGPASSSFSNGLREPKEEERHPTVSLLPTAAAVVPELPRADAVTVAQSITLGQAHPPATLHHLPASPDTPPPLSVSPPEPETSQRCGGSAPPSPVWKSDCSNPDASAGGAPGAGDTLTCGLFGHSDHINFFSAREKFKWMARDDGGTPRHSPPPADGLGGDESKKKVATPMQVIGSDPAMQSDWSKLGQSETGGQEVRKSKLGVEVGDVCCPSPKQEVKGGQEEEEEEEDGDDDDDARLYRNWTRGSVRRVTRQLERRMKRECRADCRSTSPSSSPPSHSGGPSLSQQLAASQAITDPGGKRAAGNGDGDWLSTVSILRPETTSGPGWGGVILRETWETLCQLGAFLQQVSVGVARANRKRGGAQKRVREAQARIRRAGLTPPSLMKRSASLAKLGCLELLADDLTEWELSHADSDAAPPAGPSAELPSHAGAEDLKKQRVRHAFSSAQQMPGAPSEAESPHRPRHSLSSPPLFTSRQQYGRSHPVRRLTKSTPGTLYHTM